MDKILRFLNSFFNNNESFGVVSISYFVGYLYVLYVHWGTESESDVC